MNVKEEKGKIVCKVKAVTCIICRGKQNIYCSESLQAMLFLFVVNMEGKQGRLFGSEDGMVTARGIYECAAVRQFERSG
jgi:hypothetical protein